MRDQDDDPRPTVARRALLRAAGTSAVAGGLAGCGERVTTYEFAATPVVLDDAALTAAVATERDVRTVTDRFTRAVGGVEAGITVESHLAVYHAGRDDAVTFGDGSSGRRPRTDGSNDGSSEYRTGDGTAGPVDARAALGSPTTVGVLATPAATVAGQSVNPLARLSLHELVTGDRGRALLSDAGVGGGDVLRAFEPVGATTPSDLVGAVTPSDLVGAVSPSDYAGAVTPSDYERFVGVVRDGGDPAVVVVAAGRDEVDGDVVVVAAATRRPLPGAGALANRPLVGADGLVTEGGLAACTASFATFVPFLIPDGASVPFEPSAAALGSGEFVSDGDDGTPDLAVVVRAFDGVPAESWTVYGDESVADQNPRYDPGETVVLVAYEGLLDAGWNGWRTADPAALLDEVVDRGVKFHAFPRSRLRRHLVSYGGE